MFHILLEYSRKLWKTLEYSTYFLVHLEFSSSFFNFGVSTLPCSSEAWKMCNTWHIFPTCTLLCPLSAPEENSYCSFLGFTHKRLLYRPPKHGDAENSISLMLFDFWHNYLKVFINCLLIKLNTW